MKHIVILECDKCGKRVEFPGNVLQYTIKRDDPYWGYDSSEREAEQKNKAAKKEFAMWDVRPKNNFELCPDCKRIRLNFFNQAKDKAEREFWEGAQ